MWKEIVRKGKTALTYNVTVVTWAVWIVRSIDCMSDLVEAH